MGLNEMIPLQVILIVSVFILYMLWLFILAFSGSRRIPPTHETTGLLHALVIIAMLVSCVLFVHALIFWKITPYSSTPCLSRTLGIILFAFPAIIPAGLFGLPMLQWLLLKSRVLDGDSSAESIVVTRSIVADLIRNMNETISVSILVMQESNISPFVFGFPWGKACIVLPRNFDDICLRACAGNVIRRSALIRLILSHEFSHITGRDLLTLPLLWSYCLSTSLEACALWLLMPFVKESPHQAMLLPLAILMLASATVGLLMRYRLLGARETLADATATLSVDPLLLNQLIAREIDGKPSVLEALIFLVSLGKPMIRALRWSFFGEIGWLSRMASINPHTLQKLRLLSASRCELLRGRIHLLPEIPLRFLPAIVTASVLSAFVWWICAGLKTGLILLNNIPTTIKYNWLVHPFETDWDMPTSIISVIFTMLAPALSGIVMVTALLLPFRDMFFEGIHVRRTEFGKALWLSLLAAILFGIIVSLLESGFTKSLFQTRYLLPSINHCLLAIMACATFLLFVLVKWAWFPINIVCLARQHIPILLTMFMPLIIAVLFFDQISILARIVLFILSAMAIGISDALIYNPKPDTDTYIASEWLEYERILFYKRTRLKTPTELNQFDMSDVFAGVSRGATTFTIPILLVMLIAYSLLTQLDNWFISNLPLLQAKVTELNNIPLDVARSMKWQIVRKYLGPYILLDLQKATGWNASSVILGVSIVMLVIPLMGAFIFRLYHSAENRIAMLERYPILLNLYTIFKLPEKDTIRSLYISTIKSMISMKTPFLNGPENVPRMKATCDALVLLGDHIPIDKSEAMSAWLLTCASSSGGFGYATNMRPDPLHTYHAVKALAKVSRLSIKDKAFHCRWVENQIINFLEFRVHIAPSDCLRKFSLLIRSLVLLSDKKIDIRLVQQIDNMIHQLWQNCNRTIEDIANTLHSLKVFDRLQASPLADAIRSGHLLTMHEARVISSDPKNNLPEIEALVEIDAILFPKDYQTRPCILQIQDIISKTQFFCNRP